MNAKQEMLDICKMIDDSYGTLLNDPISRIRAILETHTLEPIDDRRFDPEKCGFKYDERYGAWRLGVWEICGAINTLWVTNVESGYELELPAWPAQSDVERLLKLLGVLG